MTTIALPQSGIANIDWTLPEPADFVTRSQWTGYTTVGDLGGDRGGLRARVTLAPGLVERAQWGGFFGRARRRANSFRLPVLTQGACPVAGATVYSDGRRTNMLVRSIDFASAGWGKSGVGVVPFASIEPDGGAITGSQITETGGTVPHFLFQGTSLGLGAWYCFSIFVTPGARFWVRLGTGVEGEAWFRLDTGIVGTVNGSGVSATIERYANGYCRCSLTFNAGLAANYVYVYTATGDGATASAASASPAFWVWGAQLEPGPFASTPILTTTAPATGRDGLLTLGTGGLTALRAGQLVEINRRLFVLTSDVVGGSGGIANFGVAPDLPALTAAGQVVAMRNPAATMRMAGGPLGWGDGPADLYTPVAFDCEELV